MRLAAADFSSKRNRRGGCSLWHQLRSGLRSCDRASGGSSCSDRAGECSVVFSSKVFQPGGRSAAMKDGLGKAPGDCGHPGPQRASPVSLQRALNAANSIHGQRDLSVSMITPRVTVVTWSYQLFSRPQLPRFSNLQRTYTIQKVRPSVDESRRFTWGI